MNGLTLIESSSGHLYWGIMPTRMAQAVVEAYGRRMHPLIFFSATRKEGVIEHQSQMMAAGQTQGNA